MKRKRPNPFDLYVSSQAKPRSNAEPVWLVLAVGVAIIVGIPQLPHLFAWFAA